MRAFRKGPKALNRFSASELPQIVAAILPAAYRSTPGKHRGCVLSLAVQIILQDNCSSYGVDLGSLLALFLAGIREDAVGRDGRAALVHILDGQAAGFMQLITKGTGFFGAGAFGAVT